MDRQYDAWVDAQELRMLAARRLQGLKGQGFTERTSVRLGPGPVEWVLVGVGFACLALAWWLS